VTGGTVPEPGPIAAALAGHARRAGEAEWADAAGGIAGTVVPGEGPAPTWRDLAVTGLDLVDALARSGSWPEARVQAEYLSDYFTAARRRLHPIAAIAFQGLLGAVRARDQDELDDMAELLREIFADVHTPAEREG
jgi:hypothetical protein